MAMPADSILTIESAIAYAKRLFAEDGLSVTIGDAEISLEPDAIDVNIRDANNVPFVLMVWVEQGETGPFLYGEW